MASHTPSIPKILGNIMSGTTWKTKVLVKDINADTAPFPRAVKNAELKILNPINKKAMEYNRNPCLVISTNSGF